MKIENVHVRAQLSRAEVYVYPSGSHCDCDTPIGSARRKVEAQEVSDWDAKADAHRKQGWSETKVQRWLEQQKAVDQRNLRVSRLKESGPNRLDDWVPVLTRLLSHHSLPYIGLLLHFYSGGLEDEPIPTVSREYVVADDSLRDKLEHFQQDVLYLIKRDRGGPNSQGSQKYQFS